MFNSNQTNGDLLRHVLVPVANVKVARETAQALRLYSPEQVTVLHVVEKGEGVPDKTPVKQSEQIAADSSTVFRTVFPDADEHIAYAREIVGAIFDVTEEIGASALVNRSRSGNRIMHFLSGDLSLKLVTKADRPVIALRRVGSNQ